MNICVISGGVGRDPELTFSKDGLAICKFSIAVKKFKNGKEDNFWLPVTMFGKRAEKLAEYIKKGSQVEVAGKLDINKYEKDGEIKYYTNLIGNEWGFWGHKKKDSSTDQSGQAPPPQDDIPF